MKRETEWAIAANIAQYKAALYMQGAALIAGVIGALWHGLPSIIAGCLGAWLFHLAKPGPSDAIDNEIRKDKPG